MKPKLLFDKFNEIAIMLYRNIYFVPVSRKKNLKKTKFKNYEQ